MAVFCAWVGVFAGCEKAEISYYEVPKEDHSRSILMRRQQTMEPSEPVDGPMPTWEVPESWAAREPGPMQRALFTAAEGEATAQISVSAFPGDAGGLLANTNRWREQIGLEPVEESELDTLWEPVTVGGGQGVLVDMENGPEALIGAIAFHEGMSWFFKMAGSTTMVRAERAAFIAFLESVAFPEA